MKQAPDATLEARAEVLRKTAAALANQGMGREANELLEMAANITDYSKQDFSLKLARYYTT